MKTSIKFLLFGILILALAFGINAALAENDNAPLSSASPIHPTFAILDPDGVNVLESGQAASTMQTCGQCHDTEFIVSHAYHADLGLGDYNASAESWNASNGLFGKFDPIAYRYLSPVGDERLDLTTPDWLMTYGWRVAGGGPAVNARDGQPLVGLHPDAENPETSAYDAASDSYRAWDWKESGVIEMNCFLCHMETPNNEMRVRTIERGDFGWANTATLAGSGIVERSSLGAGGFAWNRDAFDGNGELKIEYVQLQDPTNANCAACHGKIHEDPLAPLQFDACDVKQTQTATTGQVVASQKISESGINLGGKADLNFSWDVHAERALSCTDCHYSLNNPAHSLDKKAANPEHLTYDPRKLDIGEYLQKPNHNFARGASAQFTVSPETRGTMRRCESCHDTGKSHVNFLPYNDRHMQVVACETCHIPKIYAPALASVDWTAIRPDGSARTECRGMDGTNTVTDLVSGYQPVLMQRDNLDGSTSLAPYNLVTTFFWTYAEADGDIRPVRKADLEAVYLVHGDYAPDILAAFDADSNGQLSDAELTLDTDDKQKLIADKLEALGLRNVRIHGQIQPYSINHNVVDSRSATRECSACHNEDSRVTTPILLSGSAPTGISLEFTPDINVTASGSVVQGESALYYNPVNENDKTYIFGHNRVAWIDWAGALIFLGTIVGIAGHGTLRFVTSRRENRKAAQNKPVYMYEVYERFWHWLQTFAIIILLLTGLVIHRPDLFGAFSFRYMVAIHNVLAALLGLNALVSIFWHVISGEIQQYIPHPYGFIDQMIAQARYYIQGIFRHEPHPFHKSKERKFNPLQMVTYIGLLGVLLPLQGLTGILMWLVQKIPDMQSWFGGLVFLAPLHTMNAWLFAAFVAAHVYLTTTAGHKPLDAIQAMITGWEDMEVHENSEQQGA